MVVVISIVGLVFTTLLSLSQQGMRTNNINRNKIVAAQLAQEGLELVRKARDAAWFSELKPPYGLGLAVGEEKYFAVDFLDSLVEVSEPPFDDAKTILKINGGFYERAAGTNSNFKRYVKIKNIGGHALQAACVVRYYSDKTNYNENITFDYKAVEEMYDWYD